MDGLDERYFYDSATLRPRLHETGTKSNRHEYRNLHHVYMRPKRSHSGEISFRSDRSEVIPPADRTDYVQTGMKFILNLHSPRSDFIPV